MREAMEQLFHDARVDAIFAGHVHAYERSYKVFRQVANPCGATYINIGDGGNREGLARKYLPQPDWSAFREASFGHGILSVKNKTHLQWSWHRDQDKDRVVSDEVWIAKDPSCSPKLAWRSATMTMGSKG